jgi:hypothetical protein
MKEKQTVNNILYSLLVEKKLSLQRRVQIYAKMDFMFLIKTLSLISRLIASKLKLFLITNLRRVVNFVFFILSVYTASETPCNHPRERTQN